MKLWILLPLAALAALSSAQHDCDRGACYPPVGDLLLGRGQQLQASSTCGLNGIEVFCTPFRQWKMKCCPCDSRSPSTINAHTIQDVLSTAGPNRWWQSKKDVNPVTVQLDLPNTFQLENLVLFFKGPRPSSLVIERSVDFGRSWQPVMFMSEDCRSSFPGISVATPPDLDHTHCFPLTPAHGNPYMDQKINFSPLRQFSEVSIPNSMKIEAVSGFTGLRVRLTELGRVSRLPGRAPSLFYALSEMRVMGSCFCHGHANRCLPNTASDLTPNTQVGAVCECQHNTAGSNCERCADFYNDLPWRPAEDGYTHTCKRCECNNHSQRCRFDPAVFESSGGQSGGVCEGCLHHTTGPKCDRCAPNYYPNPRSSMDRPDACLRGSVCQCDLAGVEPGSVCNDVTGACVCRKNVEGLRCDRCRVGYYALSANNPLGCSRCSCSPDGSLQSVCDPVTGQCPCRPGVQGLNCDLCSPGNWRSSFPLGTCEPCGCDPTNSRSNTCDQVTGQCQCRSGFGGRTCTECPDNTYGDPRTSCRPCQCAVGGTVPNGCDKRTGSCRCRLGVTGVRCDACSRGHCSRFPDCDVCPSCFFTLDNQLQNFTLRLERLSPGITLLPGGGSAENMGPRLRALEISLTQIRDSLPLPPPSVRSLNDALEQLRKLRDQADRLDGDLSTEDRGPNLALQLQDLLALLPGLTDEYNTKKDALKNSVTSNSKGTLSAIEEAYRESTDALKKADGTRDTLDRSANIREDALDLQNRVQPGNIKDLEKLNQQLNTRPDLTPTAVQVCGSTRSTPCTPAQCEGAVCPPEGAPPCGRGEPCIGALPLGTRALADTEEVKGRLQELNNKISETSAQIDKTQDSANQVRLDAEKLTNQMKNARDDLETDLAETRDFVKELKDFLSDPSSDPTQIQAVSDWILNAKLPQNLAALKRKLQEIKDLAAGLPNSSGVLDQTAPQLDQARKLLEEAQKARDAALGVRGDVDRLLGNLTQVEDSLSEMEAKIDESVSIINDVNDNITQVKEQLDPAGKTIEETSGQVQDMRPLLDQLKELLKSGDLLAQDAQGQADAAETEVTDAVKDLEDLEKQLKLLQDAAKTSQPSEGAGSAGDRLQALQEEARSLVNETAVMMRDLAGKETSLRSATDELVQKALKLNGLDSTLQEILADIRAKGNFLSNCRF